MWHWGLQRERPQSESEMWDSDNPMQDMREDEVGTGRKLFVVLGWLLRQLRQVAGVDWLKAQLGTLQTASTNN